jgi:WhiB family redox-sensing transcriptional regulator
MTAPWTAFALMREYRVGSWVDAAACADADPELFFPERNSYAREAKAICAECPVLEACRDYAMRSPVGLAGVWGGTTEQERRYTPIAAKKPGFPERFLELRHLGYNDLQILHRMGLKAESVLRQMQRHRIPASPELIQEAWKTKRNYKGDQ